MGGDMGLTVNNFADLFSLGLKNPPTSASGF